MHKLRGLVVHWTNPMQSGVGGVESLLRGLRDILDLDVVSVDDAIATSDQQWQRGSYYRHANIDRMIAVQELLRVKEAQGQYDYILACDHIAAFIEPRAPLLLLWGNPFMDISDTLYRDGYYRKELYYEYGKQYVMIQKMGGLQATRNLYESSYMKEYMTRIGIEGDEEFPSAVDPDIFTPGDKATLREKYHIPFDRDVVMFVGSDHPASGLHIVYDLARRYPHVLWLIVMKHPIRGVSSRIEVQRMIDALPTKRLLELEQVQLFDSLHMEQMVEMYGMADVLLSPTPYEGGGRKMLESISCNTPVITRPTGFFYNTTNGVNDFGVIVDQWETSSYERALELFFAHREQFKARAYCLKSFPFEEYKNWWCAYIDRIQNVEVA